MLTADGGSRGNPGDAGYGYAVFECETRDYEKLLESDAQPIISGLEYLGVATNNQAEWKGLLNGLKALKKAGKDNIIICLDSQLVVKQVLGEYKVKNKGLQPIHAEVMELLQGFSQWEIHHIYRHLNSVADALANKAMDEKL